MLEGRIYREGMVRDGNLVDFSTLQDLKIVTIGGGHGPPMVISAIRDYIARDGFKPRVHLSAVVNMADSGFDTGRILDQYGNVLAPGDMRRTVIAMADDNDLQARNFKKLMEYRDPVTNESAGNKIMAWLTEIHHGDHIRAYESLGILLKVDQNDPRVSRRAIPATLDRVILYAQLDSAPEGIPVPEYVEDVPPPVVGDTLVGQAAIGQACWYGPGRKIVSLSLKKEKGGLNESVDANPKTLSAIKEADIIIIGPGDLYSSVLPPFLGNGMREAMKNSRAFIVYIANLMNKVQGTYKFRLKEYITQLEKYIGQGIIDIIVYNTRTLQDRRLVLQYINEGQDPVLPTQTEIVELKRSGYRVIGEELFDQRNTLRHSEQRVGEVIMNMGRFLAKHEDSSVISPKEVRFLSENPPYANNNAR